MKKSEMKKVKILFAKESLSPKLVFDSVTLDLN